MYLGETPIPNDWQGEYCCYSILWPDSFQWRAILSGLCTLPARGRFWLADTGNIVNTQSVVRGTFDNNLHLEEVIVSCADLAILADAIRSINVGGCAPAGSPCGPGAGGAGAAAQEPTETTGDTGEECTPPPGFEDCEEYRDYKCRVATFVVDQMFDDWQRVSMIFNPVAGSIADLVPLLLAAILTPIPGDEIFILASVILGAAAINIWTTVLEAIIAAGVEREADLVCALYSASTVEGAVSAFNQVMFEELDASTTQPVTYIATQVSSKWSNFSAFNKLFDREAGMTYPEATCECADPCSDFVILPFPVGETNAGQPMGTLIDGDLGSSSTSIELEAALGSGASVPGFYVWLRTPNEEECYNIHVELDGWTQQASGVSAQISPNCGGGITNIEVSDQGSLESALNSVCLGPCAGLIIRGGTGQSFTATFSITSYTCP